MRPLGRETEFDVFYSLDGGNSSYYIVANVSGQSKGNNLL